MSPFIQRMLVLKCGHLESGGTSTLTLQPEGEGRATGQDTFLQDLGLLPCPQTIVQFSS